MDKYIIERRARIRLAWFKRYGEIGNISQVCREFGISRKTFYKWWPYYAKEGLPGLKDASKRPKSHPKAVPKEICPTHHEIMSPKPLWTSQAGFLPRARLWD